MDTQPLVLLIDLDGTIIGNILNQLIVYDLKNSHVNVQYTNKNLYQRFDKGIIRPYFEIFVRSIKKLLPNIEIFVYTASEDKWAGFMISSIEKHLNIKFNRPIFSRKHCTTNQNDCTKNIRHVYPFIKRVLQKKYGKQLNINNRIMVIDNRMVYVRDQEKYMLKCPTYSYTIPENLPALISEQVFMTHRVTIENKIRRYIPEISEFKNYQEFQIVFYKYYITELKEEQRYDKDRFWLLLLKLFEVKNIRMFTPRTIEYINKKLSKRL